jgi:hypothetical protein
LIRIGWFSVLHDSSSSCLSSFVFFLFFLSSILFFKILLVLIIVTLRFSFLLFVAVDGEAHNKNKLYKMEENSQFVGEKLAPYNPTNVDAINIAINLLKIKEGDVLYDLGCGDARFLVQVHLYVFSSCTKFVACFMNLAVY